MKGKGVLKRQVIIRLEDEEENGISGPTIQEKNIENINLFMEV